MYNTNGVRDCRYNYCKFISKDRFPKLKDFALKCFRCLEIHRYVCESTFSTMKQVKFKNRNRMANETLDACLRLAAANSGIDKERQCQRSLDHRHPTDRDF